MAVYIEEQIHALTEMCQAFICHIHWDQDHDGATNEGHDGYPVGCKHKTCAQYAEAYEQLHFGERSYHMSQLRGENERLFQRIAELEGQLGINQDPV